MGYTNGSVLWKYKKKFMALNCLFFCDMHNTYIRGKLREISPYYCYKSIVVGFVSLQKCQNSAFYNRAFKLGGDVLWTNRNYLRYGAKKICNGPMKIYTIFAIHGNFRFYDLMNTFKHLYRMTKL